MYYKAFIHAGNKRRRFSPDRFSEGWSMGTLFIKAAATGLGTGLSPFAPGTVGTIPGVLLYLLIVPFPRPLYFLTILVFICLAVYIAHQAEKIFQEKDSSKIVIDEMAGFLVVMSFVPPSPVNVVAGFVLFRFFDILKPFPVGLIDKRIHGGYGIVGDDVMAGVYGAVILYLLARFL